MVINSFANIYSTFKVIFRIAIHPVSLPELGLLKVKVIYSQ